MHTSRIPLLCTLLFLLLSAACQRNTPSADTEGDSTPVAVVSDSSEWLPGRDYGRNFNFIVRSDTLWLVHQSPEENLSDFPVDSMHIERGKVVAVVDYRIMPADSVDSIWVRIASDDTDIGWIRESSMLPQVAPDDPISLFIDFFSDTHRKIALILILVIVAWYLLRLISRREAYLVHFRDINSIYPTLLTLVVASAAVVYGTIQHYIPDVWHHYYFHPSLNPFTQPLLIAIFLTLFWFMIIVAMAAVDDALRLLSPSTAVLYVAGLITICAINYIIFSLTTLVWIGYPLLIAYTIYALWRYFLYNRTHYICGYCGKRIKQKGRCPHCNAWNE